MNIDINQISSNRPEGPKRHDNGKIADSAAQQADSKASNSPTQDVGTRDSVSLSSTAQNISKIEAELKSLPDTNQSRIDSIKARIDSGEYQVNSQNLAQKLLDSEV